MRKLVYGLLIVWTLAVGVYETNQWMARQAFADDDMSPIALRLLNFFSRETAGPDGKVAAVTSGIPGLSPAKIDVFDSAGVTDTGDATQVGSFAWALAQFSSTNPNIELGAGTYPICQTVTVLDKSGGRIRGAGSRTTTLQWCGTNDPEEDPAVLGLMDTHMFIVEGLTFQAPPGVPFQWAIAYGNSTATSTNTPRTNILKDIYIFGNTNEGAGVRLMGDVCFGGESANEQCTSGANCTGGLCTDDNNSDQLHAQNLKCSNNRTPCVSIEHSQSMGHMFLDFESNPNNAGAFCAIATGGGACIGGSDPGKWCTATADCPGGGTCTKAPSPGGSFAVRGGFVGGHQLADWCAEHTPSGQPISVSDIQSENSMALWHMAGAQATPQRVKFQNIRFAANRAGSAARFCRGSAQGNTTSCSSDAQCSGGDWCGGCTASRTGILGAGGTTIERPCCTGAGTGPNCLKLVNHMTGGGFSIDNSNIASPTQWAFTFNIDASGSAPATGSITNTQIYSTAANPFVAAHAATELFKVETSQITADKGSTWSHLSNLMTPYAALVLSSTTHTNLGTAVAGTMKYCSDCNQVSPCTSGGTGAWAKGTVSAWDCTQ